MRQKRCGGRPETPEPCFESLWLKIMGVFCGKYMPSLPLRCGWGQRMTSLKSKAFGMIGPAYFFMKSRYAAKGAA
jgi:hypothetical protein